MDADKTIALVTAAGIELTDRRRTPNDNGWHLSFSNGAMLDVYDSGRTIKSGKGIAAVERALGAAAAPAKPKAKRSKG